VLKDRLADKVMDKLIEGRTLPAEDRNKRRGGAICLEQKGLRLAGRVGVCVTATLFASLSPSITL
jgi:hypothetical protein